MSLFKSHSHEFVTYFDAKQSLSIKTKTRFYYPKTPFIGHLGTIQLDHLNQPVSDELKTKRKKIRTLLKICVTEKCLLEFITCAFILELGSLSKLVEARRGRPLVVSKVTAHPTKEFPPWGTLFPILKPFLLYDRIVMLSL